MTWVRKFLLFAKFYEPTVYNLPIIFVMYFS